MLRPWIPSLVVAIVTIAGSTSASEPEPAPLVRVPGLVASLDLDEALKVVDAALRTGELDRTSVARAHLWRGVVLASRHDDLGAKRAYENALRLDPSVTMPPGQAPHVTTPFADVKEGLGGRKLVFVIAVTQPTADASPIVHVEAQGNGYGIAKFVQLSARGVKTKMQIPSTLTGDIMEEVADGRIAIPPERHACTPVGLRITDEWGNVLASDTASDPRCVAPHASDSARAIAPPATAASERPVPPAVWIGMALTGALVATTTTIGIVDARHDDRLADDRTFVIGAASSVVVGAATLVLFLVR